MNLTPRGIERTALLAVALLLPGAAHAQNLSGVFGPLPASNDLEYRVGLRPAEGGEPARFAHRVNYQRGFHDRFLWRLVGQASHTEDQGLRFDFVQGQLFWELSDRDQMWRTGLRLDGRLAAGSRPDDLGLSWANEFALRDGWTARFNVLTKKQFGADALPGVLLETRSSVFHKNSDGIVWGVETYNLHGSTADIDLFGGRQQVGPFAFVPLGEGYTMFASVLIGANAASPDADVRLWLRKSFD